MEKKIEEIVDRLKTIVRDMLTNEEDMETKSFDYEEGIVISGNDAQLIMSALSKAEDKGDNGWISVEDRLPTENGKYLIWENDFDEAHFKNGKWISTQPTNKSTSPYLQSRFRQTLNPTHWQLLPLPPKP